MADILFAAGGSGGHLFPAIAIANELKNHRIHFFTTGRDLEDKIPKNFMIHHIEKVALRDRGILGVLTLFYKFPKMFLNIRKVLKQNNIKMAIGIGGYTSGPTLLTAKLCGIKTAYLEPNSVPGISNKLSSFFVDAIFTTFLSKPWYDKTIYKNKCHNFGLPQSESNESDLDPQSWDLIVTGGSQGARKINLKINELFDRGLLKGYRVLWQTGEAWEREFGRREKVNGSSQLTQRAFVKNIKLHLKTAKVCVARTGAGACSDIVACAVPSILIPINHPTDMHYKNNGKVLAEIHGAILHEENEPLDPLWNDLSNLLTNENLRRQMSENLRKLNYTENPAQKIAKFIEESLGA